MVTIRYGDTFLKTFIFTDSDLSLRLEILVLLVEDVSDRKTELTQLVEASQISINTSKKI